jgi:hypothetical protein
LEKKNVEKHVEKWDGIRLRIHKKIVEKKC